MLKRNQKIFEFTTKGTYNKFLVRGFKDDKSAQKFGKNVLGGAYYKGGVSYYANTKDNIPSMTKGSFKRYKKTYSLVGK